MSQSRATESSRQGLPKALLPVWIRLVKTFPSLKTLDRAMTRGHTATIKDVACVDDFLVTASWDSRALVWHVETGECLAELRGHKQDIIGCAGTKSKLGTIRFFTSADGVRAWNPLTGECVSLFGKGTYYACHATRTHVYGCHSSGAIEMYEYSEELEEKGVRLAGKLVEPFTTAAPVKVLRSHKQGCMALALELDEGLVASASLDMTAKVCGAQGVSLAAPAVRPAHLASRDGRVWAGAGLVPPGRRGAPHAVRPPKPAPCGRILGRPRGSRREAHIRAHGVKGLHDHAMGRALRGAHPHDGGAHGRSARTRHRECLALFSIVRSHGEAGAAL